MFLWNDVGCVNNDLIMDLYPLALYTEEVAQRMDVKREAGNCFGLTC